MLKHLYTAFFILMFGFIGYSYPIAPADHANKQDTMPVVSLIGEYGVEYEKLSLKCSDILLTVCQDSMELAYNKWVSMLSEMEIYSEEVEFDLKGIKIWLNVYWDESGGIKHIAYYPKPNSKNMDFKDLTMFFENFAGRYQLALRHDNCFSHYGSASFPTFARNQIARDR